jgi:hypothetical protein
MTSKDPTGSEILKYHAKEKRGLSLIAYKTYKGSENFLSHNLFIQIVKSYFQLLA